jgi:hypothetical protein
MHPPITARCATGRIVAGLGGVSFINWQFTKKLLQLLKKIVYYYLQWQMKKKIVHLLMHSNGRWLMTTDATSKLKLLDQTKHYSPKIADNQDWKPNDSFIPNCVSIMVKLIGHKLGLAK